MESLFSAVTYLCGMNLERPYDRSYWVVPGKLLAGFFPGHLKPDTADQYGERLIACDIRYVMNLMEEDETNFQGVPFPSYAPTLQRHAAIRGVEVVCDRIEIPDMGVPSREIMQKILNRIDTAISEGSPAYVHCWGGLGRTGTVVGCYLVRHNIATGPDALERIIQLRKEDKGNYKASPQTEAQRQMILNWLPGE